MKTLLLLRHAKSSWDDSSLSDHERPLNKRGRKDAPRVGELLAAEGLLPDCILGSTAHRVRETVEFAVQHGGYRGKIEFLPELYLAPRETYIQVLRDLPDQYTSAMVVGHNPGLEELLAGLSGAHEHLPTAALAQVELPLATWGELHLGIRAKLVNLWRPKELDE
jgi:phosphohistidine phosphatase